MLKPERLALELLEYKLNDMRERRTPKGGAASAWQLHEQLLRALGALTHEERQRFEMAGVQLKELSELSNRPERVVQDFDQLVLEAAEVKPEPSSKIQLSPAEQGEQAVLKRLARRVWWREVERVIERLAATCRAERERYTARAIYALTRNLGHYAKTANFAEDVNLAQFKVLEPVPELADPLISLNDFDSLVALIQEVIETALTLKQPGSPFATLRISEDQTLTYLRRLALAIAKDPYAGQFSVVSTKGVNSRQLLLAIEELKREPLREGERQAQRQLLEERLQSVRALERTQRQLFEKDVQAFRQAVESFFDQLSAYLPGRIGGQANEPQLPGGVLFAENPALRLEAVPKRASSLTVRLKGPLRFTFAGLELAIMGAGQSLTLFAEQEEHLLEPRLELKLGRHRLQVFREASYVHFSYQDERRSLAALLAEALAVYYVISSAYGSSLLDVLKTATGISVSEPQEMVRQAISRLNQLASKAPDMRKAIHGFILGAARVAHVSVPNEVTERLVERLYTAITVEGADLNALLDNADGATKAIYQLTDDPLSLRAGDHPITIRQYRARGEVADNMVAMMPGRPLGSFSDYLIRPLGNGTFMCVKAEAELAVLYFQGEVTKTTG